MPDNHPPHIPRKFFRAIRNADFDDAATFLGIIIRAQYRFYKGRDDLMAVFMASHLACALDLAGYLDMDTLAPIEPIVEQELRKWHAEYAHAENWDWILARRSIQAVCVQNGLIPQEDTKFLPDALPDISGYPDRIQMICSYIASHYQDPAFNAGAVAEHFDYNISYLSRNFRRVTGFKLSHCINLFRFQLAKELLSDSDLPVGQIAQRCGFSSASSFIRAFRANEGLTPGMFRNRLPDLSGSDPV
mgnify:CR=1 FL=1